MESLVSFNKVIEALTNAAQGVNEPPVVEKIRIVDRTRIRAHFGGVRNEISVLTLSGRVERVLPVRKWRLVSSILIL